MRWKFLTFVGSLCDVYLELTKPVSCALVL